MAESHQGARARDNRASGSGSSWTPPERIVPVEVRPSRLTMVVALVFMVIVVAAMVTQEDNTGGFMTALAVAGAVLALVMAVRGLIGRIRLDEGGIAHIDLIGRRRIELRDMDRPVTVEPRRKHAGPDGARGYELIIRTVGGRRPWLLATAAFWDRRDLERLANAIGAHASPAATRAAVEDRYPGATTWLLRRTQTQWSIALGVVLVVGLMVWQTR